MVFGSIATIITTNHWFDHGRIRLKKFAELRRGHTHLHSSLQTAPSIPFQHRSAVAANVANVANIASAVARLGASHIFAKRSQARTECDTTHVRDRFCTARPRHECNARCPQPSDRAMPTNTNTTRSRPSLLLWMPNQTAAHACTRCPQPPNKLEKFSVVCLTLESFSHSVAHCPATGKACGIRGDGNGMVFLLPSFWTSMYSSVFALTPGYRLASLM